MLRDFRFLWFMTAMFAVVPVLATAADRPPNLVVIMADDLGWGDLSCCGATAVRTPNVDRLASEGVRFTSGYCSASACTPTRYSFLTGEYAFRLNGTGIAPPNAPGIIQPGVPTIASVLKQAGNATSMGPRGDCIVEFDWLVGQVVEASERFGIANDTLVIVMQR